MGCGSGLGVLLVPKPFELVGPGDSDNLDPGVVSDRDDGSVGVGTEDFELEDVLAFDRGVGTAVGVANGPSVLVPLPCALCSIWPRGFSFLYDTTGCRGVGGVG